MEHKHNAPAVLMEAVLMEDAVEAYGPPCPTGRGLRGAVGATRTPRSTWWVWPCRAGRAGRTHRHCGIISGEGAGNNNRAAPAAPRPLSPWHRARTRAHAHGPRMALLAGGLAAEVRGAPRSPAPGPAPEIKPPTLHPRGPRSVCLEQGLERRGAPHHSS